MTEIENSDLQVAFLHRDMNQVSDTDQSYLYQTLILKFLQLKIVLKVNK